MARMAEAHPPIIEERLHDLRRILAVMASCAHHMVEGAQIGPGVQEDALQALSDMALDARASVAAIISAIPPAASNLDAPLVYSDGGN
jgi:hypothetical protein